MSLVVEDLAVGHPGLAPVLSGVGLTVEPGTIVGVVGPNGAGKTTLLESIAGLLACRGGSITLDGRKVDGRSAADRRHDGIALVREGRRIFASLSVEENLLVAHRGRRSSRSREQVLERSYEQFPRLTERKHLSGALLSGGEQQMLAIARATAEPASVLLADEPYMGLSWKICDEVTRALHRMREQGMALLVADESERSLRDLGVDHVVRLH
ncbi:ABC transporter ATP-binding protein [Pseudonocardia ailaonensis]|uniref:ABC transporter ATP-binding protein n=1 Tax=Pseudonocardia ailaonensis TaxID=367279 RepID=A0ABN2N8T0_9PSEU